ncbi:MAG: serine/threonine-protein kinase [Paracoccus sp. (in: a-proteobacteria)]|uniref:serine/threonine-protein kinase n=1 Tax=Paracoccus sp. TaxID=267 RepID=UPI0026DEBE3C|nr:serine/threonine-protein kinase [Paracoccus sp. (in: a-proteobacteria)]MDO5631664.1 serine/threonine-protein kinase [Paracoccus sp. (in: a-proteobacteria)]
MTRPGSTENRRDATHVTLIAPAGDKERTVIVVPPGVTIPPLLPARPVAPGVLINNNYRVQQMLSQGGMGEVYRAENVFTGDPVALKIVLSSLASDDGIIQMFMREARILGQLTDDAIVRYHNFVLDQGLGRYCLIMEFIDGTTLWDHVDVHGPIRARDALNLIVRLAEGLAKAHARGVTHRDLSPDNVMLRGDDLNQSVLIDFGIARAADMGEGVLAGRFAGKFKYIAPEQLGHYGGEVGARADIYGMALMIAAVLRGTPLDMGASAEEATAARRQIPDLSGIPHEVYPLLQYMLEPDPEARPASMSDVAAMAVDPTRIPQRYRHPLWGAVAVDDLVPVAAVAVSPQPPRRRAPIVAGAGVLAVAVLAAGWLTLRGGDQPLPVPSAPPLAAVPDLALPPRDMATRDGFLAGFDLGPCVQVHRLSSGLDAGRLSALSAGPVDFAPLLAGYDAAFGARPALLENRVTQAQCPALDFVRELQGRAELTPVLTLDSAAVTAGTGTVAGSLRDLRGRFLWLFLVSANGEVHDLSARLSANPDGRMAFAFAMAASAGDAPEPQLIVALASRDPLVAPVAATAAGQAAADLLPRVLDEIRATGGTAAADVAFFQLLPPAP